MSAQIQKSKLNILEAKTQLDSQKLKLKNALMSLLIDLKRIKSTISAKKEEIKSAKATFNLIKGRYKEGLSSYVEVLDANASYLYAKLGLLQAYFDKKIPNTR